MSILALSMQINTYGNSTNCYTSLRQRILPLFMKDCRHWIGVPGKPPAGNPPSLEEAYIKHELARSLGSVVLLFCVYVGTVGKPTSIVQTT